MLLINRDILISQKDVLERTKFVLDSFSLSGLKNLNGFIIAKMKIKFIVTHVQ